MQHVAQGVTQFQDSVFAEHAELFNTLATGQSPEVLFITCADSRIDPNMITCTKPGDLFVCRNAGNIVPPDQAPSEGMSASIEYAVKALEVAHIVVCGHNDCGAMKAVMDMDSLQDLPHVRDWLKHSTAAVTNADKHLEQTDSKQRLQAVIEQNVLLQLQHLATHPHIASRIESGAIQLHGWVYEIGSGDIRSWNADSQAFEPFSQCYKNLLSPDSA